METNLISNDKMKILLKSMSDCPSCERLKLNIQQLSKLLSPPFKKVKDCIIITEKSTDMLESVFDNAVKMYMDKTGYEASNTETRINSYFENEISVETGIQIALMLIEIWALKLKQMEPDSKFCLILCCDKEHVEIRFHKVRNDEMGWLTENLERYKDEAVGYIHI